MRCEILFPIFIFKLFLSKEFTTPQIFEVPSRCFENFSLIKVFINKFLVLDVSKN